MKILYLKLAYDHYQQGIYNELINKLNERGHEVTMIAMPPKKNDKEKYKIFNSKLKVFYVNGIDFFSSNYFVKGIAMITLSCFYKKTIKKYLRNETFDLILYATPPITFNEVVKYSKKKYAAKTFLMLKDIFPQGGIDLELFSKNGLISKYFKRKEKNLYSLSDCIGCMSQGNQEYIIKNNSINKEKTCIFTNAREKKDVTQSLSDGDSTVFLFGGSLGQPQDIQRLINTIDHLRDFSLAKFWMIGSGKYQTIAKDYFRKSGNPNFLFVDELPKEEFDKYLMKADVGLIHLDPRFTIPNIPSKLVNYMNLKKPIFAMTDISTDIDEIIKEADCGWWSPSLDQDQCIEMIKTICLEKDKFLEKGMNGYKYFETYYDVNNNVFQLEKFLKEK